MLRTQRFSAQCLKSGLPYEGPAAQEKPEIVLLHGWGMSSVVWRDFIPLLQAHFHVITVDLPGYDDTFYEGEYDLPVLLKQYAEVIPDKAIVLGYSLGGMLALRLAKTFPNKTAAVITVGANFQFVADEKWPEAMDEQVYDGFYQRVNSAPQKALKTFMGLQVKGASDERKMLKMLRAIDNDTEVSERALIKSLDFLAGIDNKNLEINIPALCFFGENDNLVPVSAAKKIAAANGNISIDVMEGAPHITFLTNPALCVEKIVRFANQNIPFNHKSYALDKHNIAHSFGRAAKTYDDVADLQRRVGKHLLGKLPKKADVILDLGCGTGYFSSALKRTFPDGKIFGLDIAEGMLDYAARRRVGSADWLCGDAEQLPLADESVDLIFSSLSIQWCEDYSALFSEVARVLTPGGRFVFSTLGPKTLWELRQAWQAVDNYVHVNRFCEQALLISAAEQGGFSATVFDEQFEVLEYARLKDLTRELKHLGAHNVNSGRPKGLTGKKRMQQFIQAYEQQRNAKGKLPATYQVWYGAITK